MVQQWGYPPGGTIGIIGTLPDGNGLFFGSSGFTGSWDLATLTLICPFGYFFELPPVVEKQTLDNFHDTYNHVLGSFDNSNKDKQKQKKTVESSHQVEFLEEFSTLGKSFSFANRKGGGSSNNAKPW
jgi:hypothetical protein